MLPRMLGQKLYEKMAIGIGVLDEPMWLQTNLVFRHSAPDAGAGEPRVTHDGTGREEEQDKTRQDRHTER